MENTAFRNCKFNSLCCFFHFVKFFYTNLIRCFEGIHFVHFTVYNLTFNFIYLVICKDSSDFIIFIPDLNDIFNSVLYFRYDQDHERKSCTPDVSCVSGVKKGTVGWASVESVLLCHNGQ